MYDLTDRINRLKDARTAQMAAVHGKLTAIFGNGITFSADTGCLIASGITCARFNIQIFPNCGAVAVFCDVWVNSEYRCRGVARILCEAAIQSARDAGIQALLATVRAGNSVMLRLLHSLKWRDVAQFTNKDSGNLLVLLILEPGKGEAGNA